MKTKLKPITVNSDAGHMASEKDEAAPVKRWRDKEVHERAMALAKRIFSTPHKPQNSPA